MHPLFACNWWKSYYGGIIIVHLNLAVSTQSIFSFRKQRQWDNGDSIVGYCLCYLQSVSFLNALIIDNYFVLLVIRHCIPLKAYIYYFMHWNLNQYGCSCSWHNKMYFIERKCLNFDWNFIENIFLGYSIGLDNGLVPVWHQAIA